jgi:hypothetical protein
MNLLHGYELSGKCLKVEPIKDHETYGRIRAPQKIVDYAVGPIRRQRGGEPNTMRRATANASAGEGEGTRIGHDRERRMARLEKRKTRGRYKNQQRKNSRASRSMV